MVSRFDIAIKILKNEEGYSSAPYTDTKGIWTIGYGTRIYWEDLINTLNDRASAKSKEPPALSISMDLAIELLKNRLTVIDTSFHRSSFYRNLSDDPVRQALLICMAYQLGIGGLMTFQKMLHAIEVTKDYKQAAKDMLNSKWAKKDSPARAKRMAEAMKTGTCCEYWSL